MTTDTIPPGLPPVPEGLDEYWMQYVHPKLMLCSLCGNSGIIDTRQTAISGAGVNAGQLNFCICPNGRQKRAIEAVREPAKNQPATGVEARVCEWQPITDVPMSSPCLVSDGATVEKARWMPRKREWRFPHAKLRIEPTHWMPLPQPPQP